MALSKPFSQQRIEELEDMSKALSKGLFQMAQIFARYN